MNVLIVVDAWKNCEQDDLKEFPWLEKETKLFGSFLNLQFKLIKEKSYADIIHCASGREIMDEIDTHNDVIVSNINQIEKKYKNYFFCGFHLGRCISTKIKELNESNAGIILNLSMCFPENSYQQAFNKSKNIDNYFYTYSKGFEKCNII